MVNHSNNKPKPPARIDKAQIVIEINEYDENWPFNGTPLLDAATWLLQQFDAVPERYKARTTVEASTNDGRTVLTIAYYRPETDEEYAARVTQKELESQRRRYQEIMDAKEVLRRHGIT